MNNNVKHQKQQNGDNMAKGTGKGTTNNPKGRKKGVGNKSTETAKLAIAKFIGGNVHKFSDWLDEIKEKEGALEAFKCVTSVLEYHIPKLARTEQQSLDKDGNPADQKKVQIQLPEIVLPLIEEKKRYKVYYGGRGGAKSHAFARSLLILAMQAPMRIVCAREIQKSIKDSVHRLLSDIIMEHDLNGIFTVMDKEIRGRNGSLFMFRGLKHNTTDLKSLEGADIIWIEEAENVSDKSYEIVIPTIRKEGSEIWVSFNPSSINDPTYQRFITNQDDDVHVQKVSYRDNPFFPDVLEKERKKLEREDPEAYAHIWEGMPDTRRTGAVYVKQLNKAREEGRITKVPYDPAYEVFTAWDLGFGDATAIWWLQFVGRELRWLEYYENSGEQLEHYVGIVKSKDYNYSTHYLPHDGAHGNIRGLSVTKQLFGMGLRNVVLDREADITAGLDLLRQTIAFSVFDQEKTKDGMHALENYSYEWDDERQIFKKKPKHDWASNGADAGRYAAIAASKQKNLMAFKTSSNVNKERNYGRRKSNSWMG
jgi:phage terminase large subunit